MCLILLDEQFTGYVDYFRSLANSLIWQSITQGLGLAFINFTEHGWVAGTFEREVWRFCQSSGMYLLIDNRSLSSFRAFLQEFDATKLAIAIEIGEKQGTSFLKAVTTCAGLNDG